MRVITNTDKGPIVTEISTPHEGWTRIEHSYPSKPSWKTHGEGRGMVQMEWHPRQEKIHVVCREVSNNTRVVRETMTTIPAAMLLEFIRKSNMAAHLDPSQSAEKQEPTSAFKLKP